MVIHICGSIHACVDDSSFMTACFISSNKHTSLPMPSLKTKNQLVMPLLLESG